LPRLRRALAYANMPAHTNRLAHEKSPYLLQHAHNPVDWLPWGEDAFMAARTGDRPILLSIGYSTCHWCHVMERESFEDEQIGAYLNEHFVCIKVDREERPDVDKIYMHAVQAMMGGGGGWPLNVFLTPDLKPFYGGTYFPPAPMRGRPSFRQLLERLVELWKTDRANLLENAEQTARQLAAWTEREPVAGLALSTGMLEHAARALKAEYEPVYGGFGRAPKFPRPALPLFLLRHAWRHQDQETIEKVLFTCDKMANGGIYDQLGGGFARYSVDEKWRVPHFEKMLYDNAQLVHLYLDGFLVSGNKKYALIVHDIFRYILRDMTDPEGGFYSAEDADSEGQEGKFYCWTKREIEELLEPDEAKAIIRIYGVTERGHFADHSHPDPLPDLNVLSRVAEPVDDQELLLTTMAEEKLFQARERRIRPHRDDKILASWNGLMLGAFARAFGILGVENDRSVAEQNLAFIRARLWDAETKTLHHRWRDGERDNAQILSAYAFLLAGVLDLYEATIQPAHLEFAIELAEAMIERFYDETHGGFFQAPASEDLLFRVKPEYDEGEPSPNSLAIQSLLLLAEITGRVDFRERAEKSLKLFADRMQKMPSGAPSMLIALDQFLTPVHRAVIVPGKSNPEFQPLLHAVHSVYQPNKAVMGNAGSVDKFAASLPALNKAVLYFCSGTECQPPTDDSNQVKELLLAAKPV
jgi:uncharacterized protein YyaL (SSP411 family)